MCDSFRRDYFPVVVAMLRMTVAIALSTGGVLQGRLLCPLDEEITGKPTDGIQNQGH